MCFSLLATPYRRLGTSRAAIRYVTSCRWVQRCMARRCSLGCAGRRPCPRQPCLRRRASSGALPCRPALINHTPEG
jgi:hypothetical protein